MQNNGAQRLQAILPSHLQSVVLSQLHDHVASGAHFGQHKTIEKIQPTTGLSNERMSNSGVKSVWNVQLERIVPEDAEHP